MDKIFNKDKALKAPLIRTSSLPGRVSVQSSSYSLIPSFPKNRPSLPPIFINNKFYG